MAEVHRSGRGHEMGTRTLLTALDLEQTPKPLEGGGWELDEGELVQVSPNSFQQSEVMQRIYSILKGWLRGRGLGKVAVDTWFQIAPHVVRAPDVAFIPSERFAQIDPKHALKVLPTLVIEVLGPSPSGRDVSRRVQQYLQAGIPLIWIVDPDRFEVDVYSDGPLRTLTLQDTLEASGILPGFSLPLARLFMEEEE
jgi:Uma2 family endonuclease